MNIVAHNLAAMNAQRTFKINKEDQKKSTEKLSSGYRINRAADDAAGLAISEKMRSKIRGLNRGSTNCQDGISLAQVADGALAEVTAMMHRITQLSVQAANDTNSGSDRAQIQAEIKQLLNEVNGVAERTQFNTQQVFIPHEETTAPNSISAVTTSGTPVDPNVSTYNFSADSKGLQINGQNYPWSSIKSDNGNTLDTLSNGKYTVENNGMSFSFNINDVKKLDDVAQALDGGSVKKIEVPITPVVPSIENAFFKVSDPAKLLTGGFNPVGTHTITANKSGITLDGITGINWNTVLGDGESLKQKIEAGKPCSVTFDNGLSLSFQANNRATLDGAIAALNGTTFTLSPSGSASVGSNYYASDIGGNSDYSPNSALSSWSLVNNPSNDDALKALGVDFNNIFTSQTGSMSINVNRSNLDRTTATLNFNGNSVRYELDSESKDKIRELLNNRTDIKAGDSIADLKFTYGNSTLSLNLTANKDMDSRTLFSSGEKYTAAFRGLYSGLNSSGPTLKGIADGNVVDFDTEERYVYGNPNAKEGPKNSWWIQASDNPGDGLFLEIDNMNTTILGIDDLSVMSFEEASDAIERAGKALDKVSSNRAKIGAQQNRLEHSIKNIDNTAENLQAAESRIRDVDMAKEMVKFSKENILEMVGESMVAQSNNRAEKVLDLLGGQ